uniref:AMP deaminase n=1 Tax=Prasinoderma coloniale TaxID=156133 RepID=A0A6U0MEL2_9VIRI|eukprot:PRCOL_00006432-RA
MSRLGERRGGESVLPPYPSEFESEMETEVEETDGEGLTPAAKHPGRRGGVAEGTTNEVHMGSHAPSDRNVPGWMRKDNSSATLDATAVPSRQEMEDDYVTVQHPETPHNEETMHVCRDMRRLLDMREQYVYVSRPSSAAAAGGTSTSGGRVATPRQQKNPFVWEPRPASDHSFEFVRGVVHVYDRNGNVAFAPKHTANEFFKDLHHVLRVVNSGPVKSFCHHRLLLLEQKFNMHLMLNADKEFFAQKGAPHRDFYNVRKVDTHVHHSSCMNQKHLLRFIKHKLRKEPDEVVAKIDGKERTLAEVFELLNLTGYDLNVDTLDMHADKHTFHRFDKFNLKYNPCGQSQLREIFIKQDNLLEGRYLAELTQEVFSDLMASKYQMAEYRISIYGRKATEWDTLAAWVCNNALHCDNVQWMIQIPRLYEIYHGNGTLQNFQQMIDNIFNSLFEVTIDPQSHPQLHMFLQTVVGFDMVDDESRPERRPSKSHMPQPCDWNVPHNPAFAYYAYYIEANLHVLNDFRQSKGLNTFAFRPHAGEAGDLDHLATSFLLAHNIAHGINLRKSPGLQYMFYLAQIGLCMSPLSNNSLFLDYHKNPLPTFLARGLFISLSSDDPLQIHLTKEPLVEEYSVAAQVWKLTSCDMCEMARNSVLMSGFPHQCKQHWVSDQYWLPGVAGNDIHKTNVPSLRVRYRYDTWCNEMRYIYHSELARMPSAPVELRAAQPPGFAASALGTPNGGRETVPRPAPLLEVSVGTAVASKSPPLSPQVTRRIRNGHRHMMMTDGVGSSSGGSTDGEIPGARSRAHYGDDSGDESDDEEEDGSEGRRSSAGLVVSANEMERLERSSSLPSGVTEVSTTVAETIAEGVAPVGAEANGDVASAASDDAGGKAGEEDAAENDSTGEVAHASAADS